MANLADTNHDSLFNSPLFSDIILCQTHGGIRKEYKAHKAILCAHSKWFRKVLTPKSEGNANYVLELSDDDLEHFDIMLKFMYDLIWAVPTTPNTDRKHDFLVPIGVYALAVKYECDRLALLALSKFPMELVIKTTHVRSMVALHYESCRTSDCPMGRKIASNILGSPSKFFKDGKADLLLKEYPLFAVDTLLTSAREQGRLY